MTSKKRSSQSGRPALRGFHVSMAGGFDRILPRALERGCTAFQFFSSAPVQWKRNRIPDSEAGELKKSAAESGIKRYFIHAIYLLNIATSRKSLWEKSVSNLAEELRRADMLGASGVILHSGSVAGEDDIPAGIRRAAKALTEARRRSAVEIPLIIENSAGGGNLLGGLLEHISGIIEQAGGAEPLAFCLDTAHAFAAGIPIVTIKGLKTVTGNKMVRDRLSVIHLNDSLGAFGSHRDRHGHLGKGLIGLEALKRIVRHPLLSDIPFIMETPGDLADYRRNMNVLMEMAVDAERKDGA